MEFGYRGEIRLRPTWNPGKLPVAPESPRYPSSDAALAENRIIHNVCLVQSEVLVRADAKLPDSLRHRDDPALWQTHGYRVELQTLKQGKRPRSARAGSPRLRPHGLDSSSEVRGDPSKF